MPITFMFSCTQAQHTDYVGVGLGLGWDWGGVRITFMFTCTHRRCQCVRQGRGT